MTNHLHPTMEIDNKKLRWRNKHQGYNSWQSHLASYCILHKWGDFAICKQSYNMDRASKRRVLPTWALGVRGSIEIIQSFSSTYSVMWGAEGTAMHGMRRSPVKPSNYGTLWGVAWRGVVWTLDVGSEVQPRRSDLPRRSNWHFQQKWRIMSVRCGDCSWRMRSSIPFVGIISMQAT